MARARVMPFVILMTLAWLVMMACSFYTSWLLLPDVPLLLILAMQLHRPSQLRWMVVLPFALCADVASGMPLGFHGCYDALVVLLVMPIGYMWVLVSLFARALLVLAVALFVVLLKWLMVYVLTGEPAAFGWLLTVLFSALLWPVVQWLVWVSMPPSVEDGHD